ncbi:MAG: hypothetical protein AAF824_03530 [Bacteroidota bacterium]
MALYALFLPFLLSIPHNAGLAFSDYGLIDSKESVVWEIDVYKKHEESASEQIENYRLELESDGLLKVYTPTHIVEGKWEYKNSALYLHIPEQEPISEILNNAWYIERPYLDKVNLVSINDGKTLKLVIPGERETNIL